MKKRFLSAALAAVMAMSLAACGSGTAADSSQGNQSNTETTGSQGGGAEAGTGGAQSQTASGEKVTLSLCWWGNQTRNDVTKKAVDRYMELNPNIEIKVEFTDWPGYWDKLSTMAAGGNLPDIIQQDYAYVSQYQKSGQLADLSQFIDNGTIKVDNIPQSIIDSGSINGKCYALSLGSNAPMMIYDKEVVAEAGVTIPDVITNDELYQICQEIHEKTGVAGLYDSGMTLMQIIARENGSYIFDEMMAGDATSSKEYLENVERFATADFYITPELLAEKGANVVETRPIIDQTTWNDFSFSNLFTTFSNAAGREMGMTMYPVQGQDGADAMFLKPSMFFSIAETSQHKEEAARFIDWFTNSVECNEILMAERGVPINTEVADAIKPQLDPMSQEIFEYVEKVGQVATPIDPPTPAGQGEVDTLRQQVVDDIHYGDTTAAEAADAFVASSKSILEEAAK